MSESVKTILWLGIIAAVAFVAWQMFAPPPPSLAQKVLGEAKKVGEGAAAGGTLALQSAFSPSTYKSFATGGGVVGVIKGFI